MREQLTREQLIRFLRSKQGKRTQKQFAASMQCSPAYLSDVYAGKRDPGPLILDAVGVKEEKIYRRWR